MGDPTFLPLHLGFVGESVNQPMEMEGGELMATLANEPGKKRPPSPPTLSGGDDDDDSSASEDDDRDWLASDSEDDEDLENEGTNPPFTVDDIPRPTYDFEQQWDMVFGNPDATHRGPSPILLLPAFRSCKHEHVFCSDYNLVDKSKISASNIGDCADECLCRRMNMLQIIDVKIAGYRHSRPGCAKIFGFVAAQGTIEPSRNYVYKREIRNCEPVSVKQETGVARLSLISPSVVISIGNRALIEFELHVLNEDEKGDDLIIEGCTELYNMDSKSFIEQRRMYSEKCALDIKFAVLIMAVVAQVNIEVLRVPSHGIDLKLYAKTSGLSDIIRLFKGAVLEVGSTMSFVVAVKMDSALDLYIKGSPRDGHALGQKPLWGSWQHSFSSDFHGTVETLAELGDFAEISVKVTWKSYEKRLM